MTNKNSYSIVCVRKFVYAGLAFIAMGSTACTQNEDMTPSLSGQEIKASFSIGDVQTRVNTLGLGNNWENGDKMKVKIFTEKNSGSTSVLSFNGETSKWSSSSSFRWLDATDRHTIVAVYPSDMNLENSNLQYDLPVDQSSEDKLKNADLIAGYWNNSPQSNVNISMGHRMSLVTVRYTTDEDISEPQVCSKYSNVTFNQNNGLAMSKPTTTTDNWVKAYKHDSNHFSAIVIPGSYAYNEIFMKFKIGKNQFNIRMQHPTTYKEGTRYVYTLDVRNYNVVLTQISTDDLNGWTDEDDLK